MLYIVENDRSDQNLHFLLKMLIHSIYIISYKKI